jgi:hypothetical protein
MPERGRFHLVPSVRFRIEGSAMFEKLRIREHMEVVTSTGQHVGTVDEVKNDQIKLTRSDSSDGAHHYIAFENVDHIAENRVCLKEGTPVPMGAGAN